MSKQLTADEVREAVQGVIADIIGDYKESPETDRETLIERLDEECNTLWGQLVKDTPISNYNVDDLVATAQACAVVIQIADEDAWVESDTGLWEEVDPYGVLATIAFFSLRNLLYEALKKAGYDTNNNYPFKKGE